MATYRGAKKPYQMPVEDAKEMPKNVLVEVKVEPLSYENIHVQEWSVTVKNEIEVNLTQYPAVQ